AVAAGRGLADRQIVRDTWTNNGFFYVRVHGRGGAFSTATPFQLDVTLLSGPCLSIDPNKAGPSTLGVSRNVKTLILTDLTDRPGRPARMAGSPSDRTALLTALNAFAARDEIAGYVVDLGADSGIVGRQA